LHQTLLGPVPSPAAGTAFANRLLVVDDLVLASEIMASDAAYAFYSSR
jgi:hypothetical protein